MQLPLDIMEDHLWLPEFQLENELDKLDQYGWNTKGVIRNSLYSRTQLISNGESPRNLALGIRFCSISTMFCKS